MRCGQVLMTEDELRMQFEIVRQSIGTWVAATAELVAAGSNTRQTGAFDPEHTAMAQRTLQAVRIERDGLLGAAASVADKPADLARGIEIALNELDLLERDISKVLSELRA